MKNFVTKIASVLFISSLFLSCSSDDATTISCPDGFTGQYCETKLTPSKIKITKVVVRSWPFLYDNSEPWDNGEDGSDIYPDVFIAVGYAPNTILSLSDYVIDAYETSGDLIYTFNQPLELPNIYFNYSLGLFDYDGGDEYEFMTEQTFNVYRDSDLYFPEYITVSKISEYLVADIYLSYEW